MRANSVRASTWASRRCQHLFRRPGYEVTSIVKRVFFVINILNIVMSILIIFSVKAFNDFLISRYSFFYPELVPFMLELKKPVITFSTHSIAGFYMFIFFWLNFKSYVSSGKVIFFVFAICYMVFSIFMLSNTAFGYLLYGIIELILYFVPKKPLVFLIGGSYIFGLFAFFLLVNPDTATQLWNSVNTVLTFQGSGLSGRYSSSGDLVKSLSFLRNNPISPIGMGYDPHLFYGDSGYLIYLIRGSIFLPVAIYTGFWYYLKLNCKSRVDAIKLFLLYMAFEIGISNLEYYRTIAFFPFMIVYLNGLASSKTPLLAVEELNGC